MKLWSGCSDQFPELFEFSGRMHSEALNAGWQKKRPDRGVSIALEQLFTHSWYSSEWALAGMWMYCHHLCVFVLGQPQNGMCIMGLFMSCECDHHTLHCCCIFYQGGVGQVRWSLLTCITPSSLPLSLSLSKTDGILSTCQDSFHLLQFSNRHDCNEVWRQENVSALKLPLLVVAATDNFFLGLANWTACWFLSVKYLGMVW